jgi:outer membrane protein
MNRTLLLALVLVLFAGTVSAQETKVGYVELNGLVSRMPEFASAQQRMNNYRERVTRELTTEDNRLRTENQALQTKIESGVLSPTAATAEETRLREEARKLLERSQAADQEMARIEQEEMGKILARVQTAIEDVAKTDGLAYVLNDMTTEGDIFIIYVSEDVRTKYNITAKVMAKLGM